MLLEVRRLQALLSERDAQLATSKSERDGMERSMESLASGLKTVEENLDNYREENWNLEVRNQEISTQLSEVAGNLSRVESERIRLIKELNGTRETLDSQKLDGERLAAQLENIKSKHETDMANMRRVTAGLQREKSDLQASLEGTKNELTMRTRGIRRSVSAASAVTANGADLSLETLEHDIENDDLPEEDEEGEQDVFGTNRRGTLGATRKTNDHLPESLSFIRDGEAFASERTPAVRRGAGQDQSESDRLKATLANAQKTIQTLKGALIREKEAKMDLKRRLIDKSDHTNDAEEVDEENDLDEVDENQPEKRRRTVTGRTHASRGRGNVRGGLSARFGIPAGRLPRGLQPSRLSSEVPGHNHTGLEPDFSDSSIVEHDTTSPDNEELEELSSFDALDGHRQDIANERDILRVSHGSLAGMDPAYRDILPTTSATENAASFKARQGGAALGSLMKDNRPSSAMFADDFELVEQLHGKGRMERLHTVSADFKEASTMTEDDQTPHLMSKIHELEMAAEVAGAATLLKEAQLHTHAASLSAEINTLRRINADADIAAKSEVNNMRTRIEHIIKDSDGIREAANDARHASAKTQEDLQRELAELAAASRRAAQEAEGAAAAMEKGLRSTLLQMEMTISDMAQSAEEAGAAAAAEQRALQVQVEHLGEELYRAERSTNDAKEALSSKKREMQLMRDLLSAQAEEARNTAKEANDVFLLREADLQLQIKQLEMEYTNARQAARVAGEVQVSRERDFESKLEQLAVEAERMKQAAIETADLTALTERDLRAKIDWHLSERNLATKAALESESNLKGMMDEMRDEHAKANKAAQESLDSLKLQVEELINRNKQDSAAALSLQSSLQTKLDDLTRERTELTNTFEGISAGLRQQMSILTRQSEEAQNHSAQIEDQLQKRIDLLNKRAEEASRAAHASEGDLQKQVDRMSTEADMASAAASAIEQELHNDLREMRREAADALDSANAKKSDLQIRTRQLQQEMELLASSASSREKELQAKILEYEQRAEERAQALQALESGLRLQIEQLRQDAAFITQAATNKESELLEQIAQLHEQAKSSAQSSAQSENESRVKENHLVQEIADLAFKATTREKAMQDERDVLGKQALEANQNAQQREKNLLLQLDQLKQQATLLSLAVASKEADLHSKMSQSLKEHGLFREAARTKEGQLESEIARLTRAVEYRLPKIDIGVMTDVGKLCLLSSRAYDLLSLVFYAPAAAPAKFMIDQGMDRHVHLHINSGNKESTPFGVEEDATTPKLESSFIFLERPLPPSQAASVFDSSSSYKSFDRTNGNTDYETATETEGDFEDARESLAAFDTSSRGLERLSDVSQSTILRARDVDSDQDSESGAIAATPRYRGKRRGKQPIIIKGDGITSTATKAGGIPHEPVLVDASMQTEDAELAAGITISSEGILLKSTGARRMSSATFGASRGRQDSGDVTSTHNGAGLLYIEKTASMSRSSNLSALNKDRRTSANTVELGNADRSMSSHISAPASPAKAQPPKMLIPPPPKIPPPSNLFKLSNTPTFRPPRPSSPPPPDLLQRVQTPTFLATGTTSRKRNSTVEDPAGVGVAGVAGELHLRNEASLGASPAPLPNNRQPRTVASSAQLRSLPPATYHGASTGPSDVTEFGSRAGAMTPIDTIKPAPTKFASTQRRKSGPLSSRASISSSAGSAHSRDHSIASSRMSDIGVNGLPTSGPGGQSLAGVPGGSTDPTVIHAITQTMIGEFLFKYTRGTFTKETSEKRHQRFFWIHPYTKTLYWSSSDPGAVGTNQSKAKSGMCIIHES